ncbi:MAG: urate hydroxylase PuuD [Sphingomonadales bacterium]|nr:urate hydroxylase PuuD [Sphingomonadales bacterium]
MAKLFGNLNLVVAVGLVFAIIVMVVFAGDPSANAPISAGRVLIWMHVFFGILWIGLLYYLNFVQVPTMPKVPAELKAGVTGYIAPNVFFFFRWSALFTVLTGLSIAIVGHFAHEAFTFSGAGQTNLIGLGMYLALIMAANVWFIIWPAQKKILGIVEATAEEKAAAAPRALIASRTNLLLSLPMLYCMVSANIPV